jgi:hypothetical protein
MLPLLSVLRGAVTRAVMAPGRAWDRLFFADVDARRLAALRIGTGLFAVITLLGLAPLIELHYSDAGWLPVSSTPTPLAGQRFTLLHAFTSPFGVTVFLGLSLAAAFAMTLGFHARAASWLTFLALVSFQQRNTLLFYGGDAVLRLLTFGVALGPAGRAWSIDAWRARSRRPAESTPTTTPVWPIRLIQLQIMVIYFFSGLGKLHGSTWHDGSALAIVFAHPSFSRFDISGLTAWAPFAFALRTMTQLTFVWELSFPLLVCSRIGRWVALAIGVAIHVGIIVFMRIHWFGHIMIMSYLAFLPVEELGPRGLRLWRRGRAWLSRRRA